MFVIYPRDGIVLQTCATATKLCMQEFDWRSPGHCAGPDHPPAADTMRTRLAGPGNCALEPPCVLVGTRAPGTVSRGLCLGAYECEEPYNPY